MSDESKPPVLKATAKKVRFKDPKCTGFNVPHIGTINETHLSDPGVIKVIKRDPKWFAQHFTEE